MACRPSEAGRLEKLARPARLACGLVGVLVLGGSFWVPEAQATVVASAGGLILFVAVLLPMLTDFEIDVLGIHAKAGLATRRQRMEAACLQEKSQLSSFVAMVGVEPAHIPALVDEAIQETCRTWRGRVVEDLVRQLLICRAVQLIKIAVNIGTPFRMVTADLEASGSDGPAFAALDSSQRMMVALVLHHEMDIADVAAMMEVNVVQVREALRRLPSYSSPAGSST